MTGYFFNTREDYHYDGSGYYGYLVINGDEQKRNQLLTALGQGPQKNGLGWYRYGKSFRPANDGRMYDWYIRLHSGGAEKPTAQAVDDFLRKFLKPAKPAPQPEPQRKAQTSAQVQLTRDLDRLREDVAQETAAHQEALDAQQRLAALLGKLQSIDTRISDDIEQLRHDLQDIAATWHGDQWSELNLGSVIHALDRVNERLTRDLTRLQKDYHDISGAHADTLRAQGELAQVLERLKDHDAHISEDLSRLQQDVQRLATREGQDGADDGQAALLLRFDEMGQRVAQRIDTLADAVQAGTAARAELEEARETLQEAQDARKNANAEIDRLRKSLERHENKTRQRSAINDLNEENDLLKKTLEDTKEQHKVKFKGMRDRLRGENQKLADERNRWKHSHEMASEELRELRKSSQDNGDAVSPGRSGGRMTVDDLKDILEGAFPGLVLVEDSLDTLYRGIESYRPVMALLHKIVNDPQFNGRNAVHGDRKRPTKWREDVIDKRGRVYFCKEKNIVGDKFLVYISDKNHQKTDMDWMSSNPPDDYQKRTENRRKH